MRLTVLGGMGAYPTADAGCSGYLLEADDCHLLIDPGYATLPTLLSQIAAVDVSAVLVTHGHPDHCADLNPLLRARALGPRSAASLPVYEPHGAVDAVLRLDTPEMLDRAIDRRTISDGAGFDIGPFSVRAFSLPHWIPNLGLRLECRGRTVAYTGDTGPSRVLRDLAEDADLLLAEASYVAEVPTSAQPFLSSARQAAETAAAAGVGRLWLTHLLPFNSVEAAEETARQTFTGEVAVARRGDSIHLGSARDPLPAER